MGKKHPLFHKYTRHWLHRQTGYSKGYLSKLARGRIPLSRAFIAQCCYKLGEPEVELFLPQGVQGGCSSGGCEEKQDTIGQWLANICRGLSLREAGAKTGLSHATIRDIINTSHADPESIRKLAQAFGGDTNGRFALEDRLLVLAGYRTPRPEEELSEPLAKLMDAVKGFDELQLKMMSKFAHFLKHIA